MTRREEKKPLAMRCTVFPVMLIDGEEPSPSFAAPSRCRVAWRAPNFANQPDPSNETGPSRTRARATRPYDGETDR